MRLFNKHSSSVYEKKRGKISSVKIGPENLEMVVVGTTRMLFYKGLEAFSKYRTKIYAVAWCEGVIKYLKIFNAFPALKFNHKWRYIGTCT